MWRPRWSARASTLPLLIGGATTSRVHTAVKIDPNYRRGQTVYVTDASRAVGVVSQLLSKQAQRRLTSRDVREEYAKIAAAHARGEENKRRLSLDGRARERAEARLGELSRRRSRRFLGTRVFDDYPIAELVAYIDWTPFFATWELAGKFPAILDDDEVRRGGALALRGRAGDARRRSSTRTGSRPRPSSASGRRMRVGDDIVLYDDGRATTLACCTRCASRWRGARAAPMWRSPISSRRRTAACRTMSARFAVTAGIGEDEIARPLQARQ